MSDRADSILLRMGFGPDKEGPFVDELRAHVRRQVAGGMRNRSGGTWGPGAASLTADERARAILAADWEIENRHAARVDCIDGAAGWQYDLRTGRRSYRIDWPRVPAWLGDQRRLAVMRLRIWWDRTILRRVNPYA